MVKKEEKKKKKNQIHPLEPSQKLGLITRTLSSLGLSFARHILEKKKDM